MTTSKMDQFRVSEIEITYRNPIPFNSRAKIDCPYSASELFRQHWDRNKIELVEEFKVMMLDRGNTCLGISTMSSGGITACPVDIRLIFAAALKCRATSILLAHNHPSGNCRFSSADEHLTHRLCEAGGILDIAVLDHLLITSDSYRSMSEDGNMPTYRPKQGIQPV